MDKFKDNNTIYGIDWTDIIKKGLHKIEPTMIFDLATSIIESKKNIEELRLKGDIFVNALKLHEETVRRYLENHHKESISVINALKEIIQNENNEDLKKEAIKQLVEFSSLSLKALKEQSQTAIENIPKIT